MAFKRNVPLVDENEFKERVPPRQHSPVKPEWNLNTPEMFKAIETSSKPFGQKEMGGTLKVYKAALELKMDLDKNIKALNSTQVLPRSRFLEIFQETSKISKRFDVIFSQIYEQQKEIMSLFEDFGNN